MKSASASAPGRIDFLGGVADYSGSLVLEMPISQVTHVTITSNATDQLSLCSTKEGTCILPLASMKAIAFSGLPTAEIRTHMAEAGVPHWARYPLGCLILFARHFLCWPTEGLELHVDSQVPTSMGVSSSAALEVATLRALEKYSGHTFSGTELAQLAQRAENEIVGAPCGLMDQLASAHGAPGSLLPILCRPDILHPAVRLPEETIAVGWPSGVKHAVADAPYSTTRAAAFMGRKIVEKLLGIKLQHLTELSPSQIRSLSAALIPERMLGREFLSRFEGIDDPLSTIDPALAYPIRAGLSFPVEENFRAQTAEQLLRTATDESLEACASAVGELMYQSHAGYSSIGLGCPETDEMVEAVRVLGAAHGFYGARISGGGSGGTVVVFLKKSALPKLRTLAKRLRFQSELDLPLIGSVNS